MPTLDDDQLARMRAKKPQRCTECKQVVRENYCRECDEFYEVGHLSSCSSMKGWPNNNHGDHRTY